MRSKILENLISYLQTLYTIVIAIALTNTVEALIKKDTLSFNAEYLPMVFCFLFILIPFYIGACRYQFNTYIIEKKKILPQFAPLWDFIAFFAEAISFYFMSLFIIKPHSFCITFMSLLIIDIGWLILLKKQNIHTFKEIKTWLFLNGITVPILIIICFILTLYDRTLAYVLLLISIIRTIFDFRKTRNFYFGSSNKNFKRNHKMETKK